jgi:membrane-associated phospholipid phosphatase
MKKPLFLMMIAAAAISVSGYAQPVDSTAVVKSGSTRDVKTGHFTTAGRVMKNTVLSIPADFVEMGRSVSNNWGTTAACAGGILGLMLVDKYTTTFYQDKVEKAIDYHLPVLHPGTRNPFFGGNDAYITYSLLALYGGSFLTNYSTGQHAAINSFKALAYSYVISHLILKTITGRRRPDPALSNGNPSYPYTGNPFDFGHFHGVEIWQGQEGTAFPSFHATAYFAVAKVLQMEFNNYWIPYGAVAFVFLADIRGHKHWVSDLVAGGIIGTVIGKSIVKSSRRQAEKRQKALDSGNAKLPAEYYLIPQISGNSVGLHFFVNF